MAPTLSGFIHMKFPHRDIRRAKCGQGEIYFNLMISIDIEKILSLPKFRTLT